MKRTLLSVLLAAAALTILAGAASAQDVDPLEDTFWKGQVFPKGSTSGQDVVVSFLSGLDGLMGLVKPLDGREGEYEMRNLVFKDNKVTFEYGDPYELGISPRVKVALDLKGDTLTGTWTDSQGGSGTMKLVREPD